MYPAPDLMSLLFIPFWVSMHALAGKSTEALYEQRYVLGMQQYSYCIYAIYICTAIQYNVTD